MAVSTSRKPNELVKYMYKLNSNFKQKDKTASINGVKLTRLSWTVFKDSQQKVLKNYIKSHKNVDGIVDEYINDPLTEVATDKKGTKIKFFHKKKIYTRDLLVTYKRKQLEEIAREYLIETKEKVSPFLINCIMDEQTKYRNSLKDANNFFEETNKIPKEDE